MFSRSYSGEREVWVCALPIPTPCFFQVTVTPVLFSKGLLLISFGIKCFCWFLLFDCSGVKTFALVKANTISSRITSPLQANVYILCSNDYNTFNFLSAFKGSPESIYSVTPKGNEVNVPERGLGEG